MRLLFLYFSPLHLTENVHKNLNTARLPEETKVIVLENQNLFTVNDNKTCNLKPIASTSAESSLLGEAFKSTIVELNTPLPGEHNSTLVDVLENESTHVEISAPADDFAFEQICAGEKGTVSEPSSDSDLEEPFADSGTDYEPSNSEHLADSDFDSEQSLAGSGTAHEPVDLSNSGSETQPADTSNTKIRKRGKKYEVNPDTWKRNTNKRKRLKGESYESPKLNDEKKYQHVERKAREMGPPCQCLMSKKSSKFFCESFTEADRKKKLSRFGNA